MPNPEARPAGSELQKGGISYSVSKINGPFKLVWKVLPAADLFCNPGLQGL